MTRSSGSSASTVLSTSGIKRSTPCASLRSRAKAKIDRKSIEAPPCGSEHVVPEAVEHRPVCLVLEPHRGRAVDDSLAKVRAPGKQRDGRSGWVYDDVSGDVWKRHDASGADVLNGPNADPSRTS